MPPITRRACMGQALGASVAFGCGCVFGQSTWPPSGRLGDNPRRRTPVIASDWFRIVEYPDNHLNDFCLFKDHQRTWHAIGIMGTGTWESEISLFHSTGRSLRERFENREPILAEMPRWVGYRRSSNVALQKHAPFVVYNAGLYHLFYRRPNGTILVVRSTDPYRWPNEVELVFEERDARDICIGKFGGLFHMYYCQSAEFEGAMRSCILLRTSSDLRRWSNARIVQADTSCVTMHSNLESPFVLARAEGFYLFVRNRLLDEETTTTVSFSKTPTQFPSGPRPWFAELKHVHAAELVECDGQCYLARVSGPQHGNLQAPARGGWVEVAQQQFR